MQGSVCPRPLLGILAVTERQSLIANKSPPRLRRPSASTLDPTTVAGDLGHAGEILDAQAKAAYQRHRFRGRVQGVGWALYQQNGATVEGLPQIDPTLNWVRLAQRFPVRIVLEDRDPKFPFRMGNTAVVTIQGFRDQDSHAQTIH